MKLREEYMMCMDKHVLVKIFTNGWNCLKKVETVYILPISYSVYKFSKKKTAKVSLIKIFCFSQVSCEFLCIMAKLTEKLPKIQLKKTQVYKKQNSMVFNQTINSIF